MPKELLIINSGQKDISALFPYLEKLLERKYRLRFYSRSSLLRAFAQDKNLSFRNSFRFYSCPEKFSRLFFPLWLFFGLTISFIRLSLYKINRQAETIICFNLSEKILFSLSAKILSIGIIWIELPGTNQKKHGFLLERASSLLSRQAKTLVFNRNDASRLIKLGWRAETIFHVNPCIQKGQLLRQEDIFHDLARKTSNQTNKNFFTIGAVAELDEKQTIEVLFGAVKKALAVIPNLQLIIIGDGKERKNLAWAAKKINIDNLVWFVGKQKYLQKWLNSFNMFITVSENAKLDDMFAVLKAMAHGIPVIAPANFGFDDIINDKNGLLLEKADSETIATAIIKIKQDKLLASRLTATAKDDVRNKFNLEKTVDRLEEIFN